MKTTKSSLEALESRIAPAFAGTINLAILTGSTGGQPGFRIDGDVDGDHAGTSIADAGDVNGDGYHDIIIGAPGATIGGNAGNGAAYVVFGSDKGFSPQLDLGALNGANGFKISNDLFAGGQFGYSVNTAGDVNGDGFDDVVIGAPLATTNGNAACGFTYVVFGQADGFAAETKVTTINGSNGFGLFSSQAGEFSGVSVAGGDVNGDGYADVIIGANGHNTQNANAAGAAYVVYGHNGPFNPFSSYALLGTAGTENGFMLEGSSTNDNAAGSVAFLGDFNGDGLGDFAVGATGSDNGPIANAGRTFIVYGKTGSSSDAALSSIMGSKGLQVFGTAANDGLGNSVRSAGDVNGDGLNDVIIGASLSDVNGNASGQAYVVYGRAAIQAGGALSANLANIRVDGLATNDGLGASVSSAGDFNGDGYSDLLIGVPQDAAHNGGAYVVFGKASGFTSPVDLTTLTGQTGFKLQGLNLADQAGCSVSAAGDVNGDGFDDLLIGARLADHGVTDAGEGYVVFGSNGGNKVSVSADGRSATYTDADGDLVTIKVNKGTLLDTDFSLSGQNELGGATLQSIDFSNHADLSSAKLTITAKPQVIAGSLHGDAHVNVGHFASGQVVLGDVKIGGDLGALIVGGAKSLTLDSFGVAGPASQNAAHVSNVSFVGGTLSKLSVKGDVENVSAIFGKIGSVKINGDFDHSDFRIFGKVAPTTARDASALSSFNVRGDFDHSQILGGYGILNGQNPDVVLGKITVGGDLMASSIVAGVSPGADGLRGTADDAVFPGGATNITARIASVVVKGQAFGTIEAGGHFAISAQEIGKVQVGASRLSLVKAIKDANYFLGATNDFVVNEVA